jgi:hypothetical protein
MLTSILATIFRHRRDKNYLLAAQALQRSEYPGESVSFVLAQIKAGAHHA